MTCSYNRRARGRSLPIRDKIALGRALFRDPRVPLWARVVAIALVLYLASPIDIIPDFIPVLGVLDDVLVVLVGAGLLLRGPSRSYRGARGEMRGPRPRAGRTDLKVCPYVLVFA